MMSRDVWNILMEIDEWAGSRGNYSYSMSVNQYGTSFFIYNQQTDKGQIINSVSDINENELNEVSVCEQLEEVK